MPAIVRVLVFMDHGFSRYIAFSVPSWHMANGKMPNAKCHMPNPPPGMPPTRAPHTN